MNTYTTFSIKLNFQCIFFLSCSLYIKSNLHSSYRFLSPNLNGNYFASHPFQNQIISEQKKYNPLDKRLMNSIKVIQIIITSLWHFFSLEMEMHTQLLWLTTFCITIENLSVNLSKRNLNAFKLQKGKIEIKR